MFSNIKRYFSEEEKEIRKANKLKEETKKRKVAEGIVKEVSSSYDELQEKYIKILEEKGEKFDRFLEYHDLCKTQEVQIKELKKEISDLKGENKEYENQFNEERERREKVEKELTKLQKKYNIKPPKSELEKELEKVIEKNDRWIDKTRKNKS